MGAGPFSANSPIEVGCSGLPAASVCYILQVMDLETQTLPGETAFDSKDQLEFAQKSP